MKKTEQIKCLKEFQRILNEIKYPSEMQRGFHKYGRLYSFTNEESKLMIPDPQMKKSALMILSSGDQMLDAVLKGYEKIDTIDINEFSNYYALGLKHKAIELLTYQEFCQLFDSENENNEELLKKVIEKLDEPYKEFWQTYYTILKGISHYSFSPLEFSQLYFTQSTYKTAQNNTSYLENEESYNKLKENLRKTNIRFKQGDIVSMYKLLNKYDLIYLSNVLGYIKDDISTKIVEKMYEENLNDNGKIILVGYWDMIYDTKKLNDANIQMYENSWGHVQITKPTVMKLERKKKENE